VNRRAIARDLFLRYLLPGAAGAAAGAFLTLPQAIVAAACLLGLWACWRYARP
jgi:hypothetical protein